MSFVVTKYVGNIDCLDERQVFRYMGMNGTYDENVHDTIKRAMPKFLASLQCAVCYGFTPVKVNGDNIDFGIFDVHSHHLARNLRGCENVIVFAATLGMDSELQRRRASASSPMQALVLDAMGSAAIEQLCNQFTEYIRALYPDYSHRPRFSPGYGDFSLEAQNKILSVLNAQRMLGISVSESYLMIPQKSVTAIIGLGREGCFKLVPLCDECEHTMCNYRL